jgi:hypothetical protein
MRRFPPDLIQRVRAISPEAFLRRYHAHVQVSQDGRSIVVPKVLRADLKGDHWVSCDWGGSAIGDNIALVMQADRVSFVDAVRILGDGLARGACKSGSEPAPARQPAKGAIRLPPMAPPSEGRSYLRGRGISDGRIAAAEEAGVLRYARNGVIFLGLEDGFLSSAVRSATIRYHFPARAADGTVTTKRDLFGSDKSFPFVLSGSSLAVAIVEGAVNALAVQDLCEMADMPAPTVIATGGVHVRRWLKENHRVRRILSTATTITLWSENERGQDGQADPAKQSATNAARSVLQDEIERIAKPGTVHVLHPPQSFGDAADWLLSMRRGSFPKRIGPDQMLRLP